MVYSRDSAKFGIGGSMIPANRNLNVELYTRFFRPAVSPPYPPEPRKPVIMVHGRSVPGVVAFDLRSDIAGGHYSWAQELAEAGLEAWIIELQGMGKSSHPDVMNDKLNANPVPSPFNPTGPTGQALIGASGTVNYQKQLNNSASDEHELNKMVDIVRGLSPDQPKVDLVGYSAGAFVVGPYAMKNPDKVSSLLLLAPIFPPQGITNPANPPLAPDGSGEAISAPAARYGYPMYIQDKAEFVAGWQKEIEPSCPSQRDDRIVDVAWQEIMANDGDPPVGWGVTPGGATRCRNFYYWGWNNSQVAANTHLGNDIPVLIIYGGLDKQVNLTQPPPAPSFSVTELYNAILGGANKMMYQIGCTGHALLWEGQRHIVHKLSAEWLNSAQSGGVVKYSIKGNTGPGVFSI